jgi:hypothetical protein
MAVPVLEPWIDVEVWPCDTATAMAIHMHVEENIHHFWRLWPPLEMRLGEGGDEQRMDDDGHLPARDE